MKTPLSSIIARLRALSSLANDESAEVLRLYGEDSSIISLTGTAREILEEPHPARAALRAFLTTLPDPELFALMAIMYAGRDSENDPVAYLPSLIEGRKDRNDAVRSVCEKVPRMDYIDQCLSRLAPREIDSLPTRIAAILPLQVE